MNEISPFLAGYLIIIGTIMLCCFLMLILAMIQEDWLWKTIKVLGMTGLSLGLITMLIGLYTKIVWCG